MDDFGQDRCREAESGKVGRYRVSEPKKVYWIAVQLWVFVKERGRRIIAAVHLIELGARPLYSTLVHIATPSLSQGTHGCSTTQAPRLLMTCLLTSHHQQRGRIRLRYKQGRGGGRRLDRYPCRTVKNIAILQTWPRCHFKHAKDRYWA